MSHFGRLFLLFLILPAIVIGQELDVTPTDLENFVSNPNVVIESELAIGQLESLDSVVSVVAIDAQDRANPGTGMRGVRIELHNNAWNQIVYLDQDQLTELASQLKLMLIGLEHQRKKDISASRHTIGTELCWMPSDPRRILCPSYSIDKVGETLSIGVLGETESFPLPGNQIKDLALFVELASDNFQPKEEFEERGKEDSVHEIEFVAKSKTVAAPIGIESKPIDETTSVHGENHVSSQSKRPILAKLGTFVVLVALLVFVQLRLRRRNTA